MKIGIYLGRHASKFSGMAVYSRSLALSIVKEALAKEEGNQQILIYGDRKLLDSDFFGELDRLKRSYSGYEVNHFGLVKRRSSTKYESGLSEVEVYLLPESRGHKVSMVLDMVLLPYLARHHHLDLLHGTINYGFVLSSCRQVVTVHDLFQAYPNYEKGEFCPETETKPLTRLFFRGLFLAQFKRIKHFVTDIREIAAEIQTRYGVEADRITTIPLGLDEVFCSYLRENDRTQRELKMRSWCTRCNLMPGYVLLLGSLDERKNFDRQISAFYNLAPELKQRGLLVVSNDFRIREMVLKLFGSEEDCQRQGITVIPNVSREEMPLMIEASSVVLNATLAEGFGLPAYEALAVGARVVSGKLESLANIQSDRCFICRPWEQESLNKALLMACQQGGKIEAERLHYKTMVDVARETYNLYQKICANQ